jgi:hypothetical protein
MALPVFRPALQGMSALAPRRRGALPPTTDGRQFKVLLTTRSPQQLSLFALPAPTPQPKGSRTA